MNSNTVLLLRRLLDGEPHKPAALAEEMRITPRLVRYEMDAVDALLAREGLPPLIRGHARGVQLDLSGSQRSALLEKLAQPGSDYIMSARERRFIMTLLFFVSGPEALTGQQLADRLDVSKSCADRDLAQLKKELEAEGLRLDRRVSKGSTLEGDERELRSYLVRQLEQFIDFAAVYQRKSQSVSAAEHWAVRLLGNGSLSPLLELVSDAEEQILGKWLSYRSYRMLVFMLAASFARIRAGRLLPEVPENGNLLKTTQEYVYALRLAQKIRQKFGLELPQGEISGLTILLTGVTFTTPEFYLKEDWIDIQLLIDSLIQGMSKEMGLRFYEDEEIYKSLQSHLGPTVFRLRHGIPVNNPNLPEIKKTYPECFAATVRVLEQIHSSLLQGITEDDIAYLVLYFCASMERTGSARGLCRVAILCVHGAATAQLLRELVCSRFKNIRVVSVTTRANVEALARLNVDFVISSIPIPDCPLPWIRVDPVPTPESWEDIRMMSLNHRFWSRRSENDSDLLGEVLEAIHQHCTVEEDREELLEEALANALENNGIPVRRPRRQPSLAQLLSPDKVRVGCEARNWEDAITQAGQILLEAGDVTPEFIESALQSVRSAGPYVVIMPGVALAHSEVGRGVRRFAVSMITLQEGVRFNRPQNDPVYLVLCMAPIDNFSHIRALRGVLDLFSQVSVDTLRQAGTPEELCNYLKGCCE